LKKKTITSQKKKLWAVFTKYIKARDGNVCVTCGRKVEGHGSQGGHYIAKGACGLEYYFHEKNVHCQCGDCNLRLEGNRPAYREFIIRKYGMEALLDIERNYHRPCHDYPFDQKVAHYKKKLEEIQNGKEN